MSFRANGSAASSLPAAKVTFALCGDAKLLQVVLESDLGDIIHSYFIVELEVEV